MFTTEWYLSHVKIDIVADDQNIGRHYFVRFCKAFYGDAGQVHIRLRRDYKTAPAAELYLSVKRIELGAAYAHFFVLFKPVCKQKPRVMPRMRVFFAGVA